MTFDWDTWSKLAKDDPEAFERKRIETIEALISSASPELQPRLRGLLRVEGGRRQPDAPARARLRRPGDQRERCRARLFTAGARSERC